MKRILALSLLMAVLLSCHPATVIRPSGVSASTSVKYNTECTSLTVCNNINVILDTGIAPGTAFIGTDENVLKELVLKDKGNHLTIRFKRDRSVSLVPVEIRLSPGNFDSFYAVGAADITGEGPLEVEELTADATGAATICLEGILADEVNANVVGTSKIYLQGEAAGLEASATGASSIDASGLLSTEVEVSAIGSSSIRAHAGKEISGTCIGMSRIIYSGNPTCCDISSVGMSSIERSRSTAE